MPTLDEIYNQEKKKTDSAVNKFNKKSDKVFKRVQALAVVGLAGLSPNDILSYDLKWREVLRDSGYYDMVNELVDKDFNKLFKGTREAFSAGGYDALFTTDDANKIQALKQLHREEFARLAENTGLEIKTELFKYSIADTPFEDVTAGILAKLEDTDFARYSKTYALTAIGDYQQTVIDVMAKDVGEGVWVYVGVNDDATRPYCKDILSKNKHYNESEMNRLKSDSRRDYNCRHRFYKMKKEEAEESGYQDN